MRPRQLPRPLDLFFMLIDSCMHRLSPNAWKVVCYVAAQHLRVHSELLERVQDSLGAALRSDLEKISIINPPPEAGCRSYRLVNGGPSVPGETTSRFAVISLHDFRDGVRVKRRWRDYGTGLSKSSVAAAIKEAVQSGILVRQHNKSGAGRDLASLYAINWDRVQEFDVARRKNRKMVV
jgi:hypothetical protein